MKRILALLTLTFFISIVGLSQEKLTKYYSSDWTEINKNKGKYIREITKVKESVYFIQDFLRKGLKLEMKGYFESIEPFIENGPIEFYDKKGNLIMSGKYCHGELCDIWTINKSKAQESFEIDYNFNIQSISKSKTDSPYEIPDVMPKFNSSQSDMFAYLKSKIVIPCSGIRTNQVGTVYVQFAVNEEGFTENIKITKSVFKDYDKEAIRIVKEMPQWTPGLKGGKNIKVSFTLPINFNLK